MLMVPVALGLASMMVSCSDMIDAIIGNDDTPVNPTTEEESAIIGNWCSDVSGKTYAKWNYGETWQNTEFKADGTGSTRIYYTYEDDAIGIEKIDFTYTASSPSIPLSRKLSTAPPSKYIGSTRMSNNTNILSSTLPTMPICWPKRPKMPS